MKRRTRQDQQLEQQLRDEPPDFGDEPPSTYWENKGDEIIMTQKQEIAYERWLDAAAEGRGL